MWAHRINMEQFMFVNFIKRQSPARIIAFGFAFTILFGSLLLSLPFCIREGVNLKYIDILYTSASAVCVTGLVTIDVGTAFTPIGHIILACLIQIGGLGVASVSAGFIIAMGKKINLRGRNLIREGSNLSSVKETVKFVKSVLYTTLAFEFIGAALSFIVFVKDYPPLQALGYSVFHSIAAFNNSGFDIFGFSGELYNSISIVPYQDNVLLNLVTVGLIIFGGIGFLVIRELFDKRFCWKRFSMHAKVVLSMSAALIVLGTLLLKLTEDISWLSAFFHSVSARTAGFAMSSLGEFSVSGLMVIIVLMLIGASPGSTGGGIKTTTFFVLIMGIKASATNTSEKAFRYSIPKTAFKKAAVIILLALGIIFTSTYLITVFEPEVELIDALFEMVSAFATVGLSTGLTPTLSTASKLLSMLVMYIGRLGPLTIATLWHFDKGERVEYPDGNIAIG